MPPGGRLPKGVRLTFIYFPSRSTLRDETDTSEE